MLFSDVIAFLFDQLVDFDDVLAILFINMEDPSLEGGIINHHAGQYPLQAVNEHEVLVVHVDVDLHDIIP